MPSPWRVVAVLMAVSIFGFIDRQILSLLVQPIRRALSIGDTQMSLLLGFSFAVSFTLFAIPLGRLADRYSRRSVLAAGLAGWSLCTALCGLGRSFRQMLLLRFGVGLGEATLNPCAYSIITDSFPEDRRSTALSVYSMGMNIGAGMAFLMGGLVIRFASEHQAWSLPFLGPMQPWQIILLEVGLAGFVFTGLLFTIREPVRRTSAGSQVPIAEVGAYLSRNRRTFLCHNLGFAMFTVASSSGAAWIPEMFRRNFQWSMPRFGAYFGIEVMVFGSIGVVVAGRIADRLLHRGILNANLRVAVCIAALAIPVNALVFLAPSGNWAILWLALGASIMAAPYGVAAAALHQALPAEIRSQVTALYLVSVNLIGAATGPTLTAVLTQHVFRRDDALNYSLLTVHVFALAMSAILLRSGSTPFLATLSRLRPKEIYVGDPAGYPGTSQASR